MHTRHQSLTAKKVEFDYSGPQAKIIETTGQVTVRNGPFGMKIPVGMSLGRYLLEQWNGTVVFDGDILRLKEAEFSGQSAQKLLSYAIKHDDPYGTLAYCKAVEKFNSLGKDGKEKLFARVQGALEGNSSMVFASREKTHAVTVISNFLYEAAKSLPPAADGEKDTSTCSGAIKILAEIIDSGGFYDDASKRQATLLQAGCRALWELGAGSYEFWEARLNDAPVREFVITRMLELAPTGNEAPGEDNGWSLLQKHIGRYGADIARNPSDKKAAFFLSSLSSGDTATVRAAFLGALELESPGKEVLSAMPGPVRAAIGEYAARLKAEPEQAAEADAFITQSLTSLVSARYSSREHLQAVIDDIAGFTTNAVLTSTFTDDVPGYAIGKCAQVVALLARTGALPREAPGGEAKPVERDVEAIKKSCDILVKIIDYGNDRQFAVSHDLITIAGWATAEQLRAVGLEMASLVAHPPAERKADPGKNDLQEKKRQKQAKAIAVLGHLYAAGLNTPETVPSFAKEFSEADGQQQLEVLHNLQVMLGEHCQEGFLNEADTAAILVIADLVGAVATYYPAGTERKCVPEEYEHTVELLRHVAEGGRGFTASPLQTFARKSATEALYSLGFGEYRFWDGRIRDWATSDTAVSRLIGEGFGGRAGRARKKMLKAGLASIHPIVWENQSEAKTAFLKCMLRHKEPETLVSALHAAAYLPQIPEDFVSAARDMLPSGKRDKGSGEVRNAASVFLSIAAAKDQLRQPATVFSAAHTVIDIYSAGNPHLHWAVQRIASELVPAVFPMGGTNEVQLVEGKETEVRANLVTPPGFDLNRQRAALTVIGKLGMAGIEVPGVAFTIVRPEQEAEDGCGSGPLSEGIRKAAGGIAEEMKILANPTVLPGDIGKR